jgi:hypothetical protein
MTDEPLEPEVPAEEIVIADDDDLKKAIAEHDAKVDQEVRRLSRRGFIVAGAATVVAYGAWKWLRLASREGDVPWPLRRGLRRTKRSPRPTSERGG